MRLPIAIAAAGLILGAGLGGRAAAQESLDEIEQAPSPSTSQGRGAQTESGTRPGGEARGGSGGVSASVNGYLNQRFGFSAIDPSPAISTRDTPALSEVLEVNTQLKLSLPALGGFAYSDLSLLYQNGWVFYERDASGGRRQLANHDVPSLRPMVVASELYVSSAPRPWLNVLVGKKRVTWGAGVAFNPTDLINPPKDPTDPNYQRAGGWIVRVEAPFEKLTLTGLFAPQALYAQDGLPYAFLRYPRNPPADQGARDDASHYLLALRLYALLNDTDINLVYFYSNRYQDAFERKSRWGVSLSRVVPLDVELHLEALLQRGSDRSFPDHGCVTGASACEAGAALAPSKISSRAFLPRVLLGARRQFDDESMLSVEYYYQADGYSGAEFRDFVQHSVAASSAGTQGGETASQGALPQRVAFDPLRRHYAIASFSKPRIFDDWTASAVLIAGLGDLSGLFSPSIAWTPRDWVALSLFADVPIRGLGAHEAKVNGRRYGEYSLVPYDYRLQLEARLFY